MNLGEHSRQGMMAGPSRLPWVVRLERTLLPVVTLEDGRVHVQGVAFGAYRRPLRHPLCEGGEETVYVAHLESAEQIADRVAGGEARHAQQGVRGAVAAQKTGGSKSLGSAQHRDQESRQRESGLDLVGRSEAKEHVLAHLADEVQLARDRRKHSHAAEGRYRARCLAQDRMLPRKQRPDLTRDWIARCL